jgi:hypothetical protein
MSDPSSAAAVGVGTGIGAMVLATLGVEPHSLLYGAVGATVGVGMAAQMGRVKSVFVFLAVVMLSASFGTAIAAHAWPESSVARNAMSGALGLFFHPLLAGIVSGIPQLVTAVIGRIGNKPNGDQQ